MNSTSGDTSQQRYGRRQNGERELTYRFIVSRFSSYATIHGLPRILLAKGAVKTFAWVLLTLACTGGFVYNFYYLTRNFMDNPVYVMIDVLSTRQMPFPAVSICNTNPVKRSAIGKSPELSNLLEDWQGDSGRRRRKRDTCPNAEEPSSGICFWMSDDNFTQNNAVKHCSDQGATLAIVDTQEKFDYLFDTLGFSFTWINLKYSSNDKEWQWGDGSSLSWSSWQSDPGTPPSTPSKRCVFVSHLDTSSWMNEKCEGTEVSGTIHKIRAICMRNYTAETEETTSPVQSKVILKPTLTTLNCNVVVNTLNTDSSTAGVSPHTTTLTTLAATTSFVSRYPEREVIREDFKKETEFLETLAEIPLEEKEGMGYNLSEFILSSMYNGRELEEKAFGHFYHAAHGNCYVFNSGWDNTPDILYTSNTGRHQGFHVLLNIGQNEYIEGITESAGAVVVVHDQSRMPFPEDEGVLASPGHVTSISITRVDVSRLGDKYSDCIEPNKNELINVFAEHFPVNYSISACEKTCYQKHLIANCRCGDPQYPTEGQALGTGQADVCDIRNNQQDDCVYGLTLMFVNGELDCDCPLPCQDTLYTYKVSKMMWPTEKGEQTILDEYNEQISAMLSHSSDPYFFRRNLLKVEVYFEQLNRELLEEMPKYPLARYMSGVGAIIGLWMGCSVLSLIEFVEFIGDFIIITCKKVVSSKFSPLKSPQKSQKKKNKRKRKITPDSDNRKSPRKKKSSIWIHSSRLNYHSTTNHHHKGTATNETHFDAWQNINLSVGIIDNMAYL